MGLFACVFVVASAGCGGGGGGASSGSNSGQGGGSTTPAANVTVAITSPAINASLAQGDAYSTTVSGTWSSTNLGNGAVFLQVSDSAGNFTLPAIQTAPSSGAFSYSLSVVPTVASGERTGTITIRACKDATCAGTYAGTSGSVNYRLTVTAVPDWETLQGNASHNGYVPITLDPTKFTKAWEWLPPHIGATRTVWLGMPVTGSNGVYVMAMNFSSNNESLDGYVALEESNGNTRWSKPIGTGADPAFGSDIAHANGRLYFTKTVYLPNSNQTYPGLIALLTADGNTAFSSTALGAGYGSQAPTPFANSIFANGELPNSTTRGHVSVNGTTGSSQWATATPANVQGQPGTTPSVDSQNIYYHSACCLEILDRQTGAAIASIPNPNADAAYTKKTLYNPTLLGTRGNVLALPRSPAPVKRLLSSFNIANKTLEWTTPLAYGIYPAVANGVVYAIRIDSNHVALDAINESTGQALWTWTTPEADGQFTTLFNVVATKNMIFFSAANSTTNVGRLWAIDISARQQVWSYPAYGQLAISSNRRLFLSASGTISVTVEQGAPDDKLIAFKLN